MTLRTTAPYGTLMARTAMLLGLLLLALASAAPQPLTLTLEHLVVHVIERDGQSVEEMLPAVELRPGAVLVERLTAVNTTSYPLPDVTLTIPVSPATRYLDGSAVTAVVDGSEVAPEFSFDGGLSYGTPPLRRTVVTHENGVEVTTDVVVPASEYTHIRWRFPSLPVDRPFVLSFRSLVE